MMVYLVDMLGGFDVKIHSTPEGALERTRAFFAYPDQLPEYAKLRDELRTWGYVKIVDPHVNDEVKGSVEITRMEVGT